MKKDIQDNGKKKKKQKSKQWSTKHTHKTKDRVTWAPLTTGGELRCSGRVGSSCSSSGTHRIEYQYPMVNICNIPCEIASKFITLVESFLCSLKFYLHWLSYLPLILQTLLIQVVYRVIISIDNDLVLLDVRMWWIKGVDLGNPNSFT